MLEVRHLTKIYSGKGGVSVKALDDVSVVFPETGMVFLLGKSGSGKSTLLNVAGGLDKPDDGEVIVKGKSSKSFSGSDFDSYRNTFIGFVFQEYNILNEFTIEQNIALALQLQSKPNNKAAVSALLEQVDLAGYAKRKPNTLSGGQKQRVAIARALIKEPEIIMADEPTGALDSSTGKQVLDTLKKLSEKKLVIVVSHDREFAEQYGDRIIELKDGKIISDVSKVYHKPRDIQGTDSAEELPNVALVSEDTIAIRKGEELTDEDLRKIAALLREKGGEAIITADRRDLPNVKRACRINENGNKESFKDTVPPESKPYDGEKTKFIKSRLPLGHAVKMGASGLKSKPIRLIFTILLAVAAFILFGLVSTFMLYDPDYSISEALKEADYPSLALKKYYTYTRESYRVDNATGETTLDYTDEDMAATLFGASEVAGKNASGLSFAGVFNFTDYAYPNSTEFSISLKKGENYIPVSIKSESEYCYPVSSVRGFSDCGAAYLSSNGFTLLGSYPTKDSEIALTKYLAELFINTDGAMVSKVSDLIGAEVRVSGGALGSNETFTVTGVVTTGAIPTKYDALKESGKMSEKERTELASSLADLLEHGFESLIFVSSDFYDRYADRMQKDSGNSVWIPSKYAQNIRIETSPSSDGIREGEGYSFYVETTIERYKDVVTFKDPSGKTLERYLVGEGEIFLSRSRYFDLLSNLLGLSLYVQYDPEAQAEVGDYGADTPYRKVLSDIQSGVRSAALYEQALAYLKKWYGPLAYKDYLYNAMQRLCNVYNIYDPSSAEYRAYDKVRAFVDYYYSSEKVEEAPAAPTAADWAVIEAAVEGQLADAHEQMRYGLLVNAQLSKNWSNYLSDDVWSYMEDLKSETCDEETFAERKAEIEGWFTLLGASLNAKEYFAADPLSAALRFYYCDKNGNHGVLRVAGYMDGDNLTDYYVLESFLNAHATMQKDSSDYYWYEVKASDYTRPADAKYNSILSLTDNSLGQISAALSSEGAVTYRIDNAVASELDEFLELILDLEKIFLYVGLGVGLLAAFFLLNFISVSISTKRKDIGILRAVGARGSDVFKIFYAEAFIIALICFVLASVGSYVLCFFLNRTLVESIHMTLLRFGALNIALIFGISIFVSLVATFLPVYFAARKSPVDSIRAL